MVFMASRDVDRARRFRKCSLSTLDQNRYTDSHRDATGWKTRSPFRAFKTISMQITVKGRHYFEAIKGTDEEVGEKFANAGMR